MTPNSPIVTIDPLDADAMERLAFSQNGVALVRYHKKHPSFGAAHAQTMLAVYMHLTDLADHTVFPEADYAHLPGGNERDGKTHNAQVTGRVAATVGFTLPKQADYKAPGTLPKADKATLTGLLEQQRRDQEEAARQAEEDARAKADEVTTG